MGAELTFTRILDGEHIVGESNDLMSRDTVVFDVTAVAIPPGTVMGRVTANGRWKPWTSGASDGSEVARGFNMFGIKISTGTQRGVVHARDTQVNGKKITWPAGTTQGQKDTQIANLLARSGNYGNVQVLY